MQIPGPYDRRAIVPRLRPVFLGLILSASIAAPARAADAPPRIVLEAPQGAPFSQGEVVKVAVWLESESPAIKSVSFGVEGEPGTDVWFAPSPDLIADPGVQFFIDRLIDVRRVSTGLGDFDFDRHDPVIPVPDGRLRLGTIDVQVNAGPPAVTRLAVTVGDCRCAQEGIFLSPVVDLGSEKVTPIGDVLSIPLGDHDFLRGDANGDGRVDLSDAIRAINDLFASSVPIICPDALDANDDGDMDVSDPVYLLAFFFLGGPAPKAPYPAAGPDPTPDRLPCGVLR